jgi:aldehyde:ferredoxin oxidoreductase
MKFMVSLKNRGKIISCAGRRHFPGDTGTFFKRRVDKMKALNGTILRINLGTGGISRETLDEEMARQYIGGRGIATKILYDELPIGVDPLSPDNKLIFASGPLTGTAAPTGGRYMVVTKGPLNGAIASSNSGGFFGKEFKTAGYDLIIFEGKAEKPVYVWIKDGDVEIRDASDLWGKTTHETTDLVMQKVGDGKARVACIGPAGEKLSEISCIINDKHRAAGRTGVGAVMGSKNLKAVAVRGTGKVELFDKEKFREAQKVSMGKIKENPTTSQGLPAFGTAVLVNVINENGLFPTNNFQGSVFKEAGKISGETLADTYLTKNTHCFACPIGCGRATEIDGKAGEGPEYEVIWSFGADCGVDDLKAVVEANFLCNELGLDGISAGATIAAAMELAENNLIPAGDLDGPELKFGSADAIVAYTKKMGYREGFGDKLAEGSYRLTSAYGHPEYSMSVKKQELPAYDPRGAQGHGLEYATSNRGGCHVRGYMISPEILGAPEKIDPQVLEGKPQWVKIFQDLTAFIDACGLCLFSSFALGAEEYGALVAAATGWDIDADGVLKAGERIWNLERLFNLREGFSKADDTLPERLLKDPVSEGPNKGKVHRLGELLPDYYKERGWDKNGVPTEAKKKELGL